MMQSTRLVVFGLMIGVTAMVGCHRQPRYYHPPSIEGLRFSARAEIMGRDRDTLRVTVDAVNRSKKDIHLEFGQCSPFNDLQAKVSRGTSSWDSRAWEQRRFQLARAKFSSAIEEVCVLGVLSTHVAPGKVFTYRMHAPVAEILGDSLRTGRYRITARLSINGRDIKNLDGGEVDIPQTVSR